MNDSIKALSYMGLGIVATITACLVQHLLRLITGPTPLPHLIGILAVIIGVVGYTCYPTRSPRWMQYGLIAFGLSSLLSWH
ncbi:MAG: hypothetical protein F6J87_19660 [Spirulina sp. SIO3F2]|nr:hypothetical protein [Spirulina sp. SIO3F2]